MANGNPPFLVVKVENFELSGYHRKDPQLLTPVLEWDQDTKYHIIGITYHRSDHFVSCIKSKNTWLFYDGLDPSGLKPYDVKYIQNARQNYFIYIRVS